MEERKRKYMPELITNDDDDNEDDDDNNNNNNNNNCTINLFSRKAG